MQIIICGLTAVIPFTGALAHAIAAITASRRILIAVSTSAVTGGSGRVNRPRPWYFLSGTMTVQTRSEEITGLLKAWAGGDQAALERLVDQVYNGKCIV